MGRPEPCVLFSQTFVHPQLDEYVDEVLFSEPIVITACEFIELNSSSASQAVSLVGATSPPSFALEVFVQCEGETRFRRLCHPFLYSHSSSNLLEVEAVVTNHLVVRGSYRSLSLVIYGNTAEDLGQFSIEFDDNSLSNLVTSAEGKLEDLPLALRSTDRTVEESLNSLKVLSLAIAPSDLPTEVNCFVNLFLKIMGMQNIDNSVDKIMNAVVAAVCSYVRHDVCHEAINQKLVRMGGSKKFQEISQIMLEATKELLKLLQQGSSDESAKMLAECSFLEPEADLATSKELVDMLSQYFCFNSNSAIVGHHQLRQSKNVLWSLSVALLLCSGKESCFHFVHGGGMELVAHAFSNNMQSSSAVALMLLGVIEQATRYPIGCEGILGWWPREDKCIPSGISNGYSQLLKLFLQKPRHDVTSLSTYVLHRLRFYEVASRYESAVLLVLDGTSVAQEISIYSSMLRNVQSQLNKLLKLINIRGPIEDPSPLAHASRSLIVGESEGLLTYKTTRSLISSSKSCFSNWDIDSQLLLLLKEKGFLPLSAALLSSPMLRRDAGDTVDIFSNIVSTIGAILLSLLTCRSGLIFLLHKPELSTTLIDALRGISDMKNEESAPLSYASALLSKGFVCSPQEVGINVEMHLRVVNAIDRLLLSTPYSEEFLWVLWELCGLSRSECGRQALLVLVHFPEAISILIEALHSFKESEPVEKNAYAGTSPINLATFHSAAEIFEVIVTDATASSLNSWIDHAMELHKALHSSSPGSIRKDAPTRLLELVDAGAVYQKNGAIALLRYSAVLASGGDAHLTSSSILVADLTDVDSAVGDSSGGSDVNVMDNLGKIVSEKTFDGFPLRDSSITQLTTATRILAFVSESSTVAAALYDEGAIIVIYAILVNCSFMLERSSNNYDYLVDDGTECNSTSDLLLERNREQSLVDLLIPSLVLLLNLLQKLKDAKEQHRNTKLLNALLRLHREVSPKLAACAADLSSPYPDFALGFGAVCHLVVSALTCWPVYGWTPGLFHSLLANVHATSILALGPKETCSLLCLLNDLFPEEGLWLWRNGIPLLTALRKLAVGTLLGSQKEIQINWYLKPSHVGKLLGQLSPHLDKIAQIIQHYAISALVVIQDMLRVFIVRIACLKAENAAVLLRPMLSFLQGHVSNPLGPSEMDVYKVYGYLEFLASLLEHPCAKALLLEESLLQILAAAMERCFNAIKYEGKQTLDTKNPVASGFTVTNWCLPIFKSFSFLCSSPASLPHPRKRDLYSSANLSTKDCSLILPYLLKFCEVLPIGRELLSCLLLLKDIGSSLEGRCAFMTTFCNVNTIDERKVENGHGNRGNHNFDISEYKRCPPFLCCWTKLLKSVDSREALSTCAIQAATALSIGCVQLCFDGKSLNLNAVSAIKFLFGLYDDTDGVDGSSESVGVLEEMVSVLSSKITDNDGFTSSDMRDILFQALELTKSLLLLLTKPSSSVSSHHIVNGAGLSLPLNDIPVSSQVNHQEDFSAVKADDYIILGGLGDKFLWECPLPDRLSQNLQAKRKLSSLDGAAKRVKGESSVAELAGQNSFGRNLGPASTSSGPTRRDTFRQRKPNTSRPPSMHVDDYVARERSVDGVSSNVIAVRVGSSSGRAPSIHVDEFMARQRERQNPSAAVVEEPSVQVKNAGSVNDPDKEKVNNSKQLKADLDDDLHGIDIVFDGEESEADDKLPFLQPDDILQQPDSVMVEQRSPHSIIEEPEKEANASMQFSRSETPVVPNNDENAQSEFSSRMSVSRPEIPLTREPSVSSDKKFYEHSDDLKNIVPMRTSNVFDSVASGSTSGFPPYSNVPESLVQLPTDSRMNHQSFYAKDSPQHGTGSWGTYDQKVSLNQPPLPPTPPPPTFSAKLPPAPDLSSSLSSPFVNSTEMQHPMRTSFHVRSDYLSPLGNVPTSVASSISMPDTKYARGSMSSPNDAGPQPPLPPMPPPFSASSYHLSTSRAANSGYSVGVPELLQVSMSPGLGDRTVSGAGVTTYASPPLIPSMVFSRPVPVPVSSYGSTPTQQQNENSNTMQSFPILPSSVQSIHQLQPLQPPLQRPPLQSQHLWPMVQPSHHVEQGSLQSSVQMQVHQMEMLHQPHIPSLQTQYQSQQQEYTRSRQPQHRQVPQHSQTQVLTQQADVAFQQQQQDFGLSLQEYFQDPKAITSLLSNKEELCRLLEQHPKLMQMLQERLGQP